MSYFNYLFFLLCQSDRAKIGMQTRAKHFVFHSEIPQCAEGTALV